MPLPVRWSTFTKDNITEEPNYYGVYEIGNNGGSILYIGQGRIRGRLNTHFIHGNHPIGGATKYRKEITNSKQRAKERERAELGAYARNHGGDLPPYNKRLG